MSCGSFWKSVCDIPEEVLASEYKLYGSYSRLAEEIFRREQLLRNHLTHKDVTFDPQKDDRFSYILVEPVSNGYCFKLRESSVNSPLALLHIEGSSVRVSSYIENPFPHGHFSILWCTSTPDNVLLHGNNATWVEFSAPPLSTRSMSMSRRMKITQWESPIVPVMYNNFSRCEDCLLVVSALKHLNFNKYWEFVVVEMGKHESAVSTCKIAVDFLPYAKLKDHRNFLACKISLFSASSPPGCYHLTCPEHFLLVQYGTVVVKYKVIMKEDSFDILPPLAILSLSDDPSCYLNTSSLGNFVLSQDKKLLAIMVRGGGGENDLLYYSQEANFQSHVWNLESNTCQRFVMKASTLDPTLCAVEYLSVGRLYHVIALKKAGCLEVCVKRVGSGGRLIHVLSLDCTSSYPINLNEYVRAHPYGDKGWLDSISSTARAPLFATNGVFCVTFPHGIRALTKNIRFFKYINNY